MLVTAFRDRGYEAALGFLFEREPDSQLGIEDFFVVSERPPIWPQQWLSFAARCGTEIVRRNPKAIFGFQPLANVVGALSAAGRGCRMVATQRNPADRQSVAVGPIEAFAGGVGLYHANVAVSETVRASYARHGAAYREKLRVVYNATPALPKISEDQEACRNRFGVVPAGLLLGCLGRLHPQKNVGFALQVLAGIPGAELLIAGGGPEEGRLRELASQLGVSDRVHFLGPLSGADLPRFYRCLDILLFPSIYEGFGRVLVEAMAAGTPVVSSDIAIAREVAGTAVLYRPLDPEAWCKAIVAVAGDSSLRGQLVSAGVAQAERFSLDAMVDGYLDAAGLDRQNHG